MKKGRHVEKHTRIINHECSGLQFHIRILHRVFPFSQPGERVKNYMDFGIYKTFTFHVNMPKDPLSSLLLGIYFTFAFKSKGLKGDLFVIFT